MGDYVSVSAENIQHFAEALFAKFEQELCVALENYDDDHLNGLIKSAREQIFPGNPGNMMQGIDSPRP